MRKGPGLAGDDGFDIDRHDVVVRGALLDDPSNAIETNRQLVGGGYDDLRVLPRLPP
jgi:hypothetical protein